MTPAETPNTSAGIPIPRRPVRVRIAPSPTGEPHVGTAYIALFNLAFARKHQGQFILRIEDTDQKRSTPQSEAAILKSLRWCGLQWDEGPDVGGPVGPYRQSERSELYQTHAQQLINSGRAYRCFCSAQRLDEVRAAQRAAGQDWRYDGHCRGLDPAVGAERATNGETHVIRLKMPTSGETIVPDALRGGVRYENHRVDDQILLKSDGLPTYHLANVVDDHLMAITHVIRAEEWINSTPKHIELYDAFGWEPPVFIHMPLLRNADKSKISKRKNPVSLDYYRRSGILPEAFVNFLGHLGYSMPDEREVFTLEEFIEALDLTRISLGGPVFDLDKLSHINGLHIRALSPTTLSQRVAAFCNDDELGSLIAELARERMDTLADMLDIESLIIGAEVDWTEHQGHLFVGAASKRKNKSIVLDAKRSRAYFDDLIARMEALKEWNKEAIETVLREAVAKANIQVGDGFMAVRVAIAGRPNAPGLFETLEALGRALSLARLRRVSNWLKGHSGQLAERKQKLQRQLQQLEAWEARIALAKQAGGRFDPKEGQ
ncbi:MAG TPA: glutamate--tRNA ligase [Myxococcales bacterium]|nr:glutamate--tRNA ligase [Myxococcales bacterium]HAN32149.1 glutamate--tRNA ligase [Myxococcales bacterium]